MDIDDMPPGVKFVFIAMLQSAITFKEMEKDKKFFVSFAEEIWETMQLSDLEDLKETLQGYMKKEIQPAIKDYIERNQ